MGKGEFEEVFQYDSYDGPITGVANWHRKPYYFEYQGFINEKDIYYLSPIKEEVLELVRESWRIWKRWDIAFYKGEISIETHPYLPSDKKRGKVLKEILDKVLEIDRTNYVELEADFRTRKNQEEAIGQREIMVKWKE